MNYSELVLLAPGWSAQTCDVNSLSRCNSKLRIISSKDVPVGPPEGLNRQSHSEQPKPRKRCRSIHTSFRLMVAYVAAPLCGLTHALVPACRRGRKPFPFAAPVAAWRRTCQGKCGVYTHQIEWSVGNPTYTKKSCSSMLSIVSTFFATCPLLQCALLLRLGFEVHGNFVSGEIGNPAMAPQPGDGDWRRRPGKADDPD